MLYAITMLATTATNPIADICNCKDRPIGTKH